MLFDGGGLGVDDELNILLEVEGVDGFAVCDEVVDCCEECDFWPNIPLAGGMLEILCAVAGALNFRWGLFLIIAACCR